MCLIALALNPNSQWRMVLAANRDEYLDRPTAPLSWWPDGVTAGGRDLRVGGSWMALSKSGRFAAVTNVRLGNAPVNPDWQSRGNLIGHAIASEVSSADLLDRLGGVGPCNLLWGDLSKSSDALFFTSNQAKNQAKNQTKPAAIEALDSSQCYGLSNAQLNANWPKTIGLKKDLLSAIAAHSLDSKGLINHLFSALSDATQAPDDDLPETGVSLAMERTLSARFIATDTYGTRSSTVMLIDHQSRALIIERSWDHAANKVSEHSVDQHRLSQLKPYTERSIQFRINPN